LADVISIAAGGAHSLAIGPDLGVWAWGQNFDVRPANSILD
jgi:alpha-tubulin suppressor-like RCC1 family protein